MKTASGASASKRFNITHFSELLKQGKDEEAILYFCNLEGYKSMMGMVSRMFGFSSHVSEKYNDVYSEIKTMILTKGIISVNRDKHVNQMNQFFLYCTLEAYKDVMSSLYKSSFRVPESQMFSSTSGRDMNDIKEVCMSEANEVTYETDHAGEVTTSFMVERILEIIESIEYSNERDKRIVLLYVKSTLDGSPVLFKTIGGMYGITPRGVKLIIRKYFKKIRDEFPSEINNII